MANLVFDFLHHYQTGERRASDPADAYQYDEGHVMQAIVPVEVTSCEIHYWVRGMEEAQAYTPDSITQNADGSYSITGHIPNTYFETYGDLRVYIVVTDGSASITTYEGRIHICERAMPDDYVDDDPDNEAVQIIAAARGYAETSEAWAVGQVNGEDVPSTADQYQNNAAYYANQAASAASSAAAQASLAPAYDNTATYEVGDYCLQSGQLYECTTAITTAEAWTSAHWTAVTVGGELTDLKEDLNESVGELKNALSDLDAGKEQIRIIKDVYIATNGDEVAYNSWSASDYIPINGAESISITSPANNSGNYDAFYDANKTFVPSSAFNLKQGENIIAVPDGAVYFRISNTTTAMEETVVKWWLAFEVENINNKISTIPFVSNNDQCNKFFKELYLEGADPSITYKWYFAARNNSTYGYNATIAIDGTTTIVAYLHSITAESTEPIIIPEHNNSGVTGYAVLDWSALENGSNKTYNIPLNKNVKDVTNSPVIYSYLHQGADSEILIAMPERINAVVGDTLQLYYQGMFRCVNAYNYAVTLQCDVGAQYPRYYELTPTATNVGEHTLTVQLRDNNGSIISKKNVVINVVSAPTSPVTQKNIFCVGASCTQNGEWVGEFKRKLTEDYSLTNINFIGRMAVNGTRLEATGGYTWSSYTNTNASLLYKFYFNSANLPSVVNVGDVYSSNGHNYTITEINIPTPDGGGYISCTSDGLPGGASGTLTRVSGAGDATLTYYNYVTGGNPFVYSGAINLPQYMTDHCGGVSPDVVYTELFVNGSSPYNNDVTSMMNNMKAFAQMFHAAYPNCKIAIGMPYCPDEKGGTGKNYNAAGGFSWQYGIKYTFMEYMKVIENYLSENDLSSYVSLVDWTNEFDSENDFYQTTKPVNVRSNQTEVFGVNGIHPTNIGYMQMADSVTRHFVTHFCQGT